MTSFGKLLSFSPFAQGFSNMLESNQNSLSSIKWAIKKVETTIRTIIKPKYKGINILLLFPNLGDKNIEIRC